MSDSDYTQRYHAVENIVLNAPTPPPEKIVLTWWVKSENSYLVGKDEKHDVLIVLEKFKTCWRATVKIGKIFPLSRISTKSKEAALWAAWSSDDMTRAREKLGVPHTLDWGDFDYNAHLAYAQDEPTPPQKKSASVPQAKIRTKVVYGELPVGEQDEKFNRYAEKMAEIGVVVERIHREKSVDPVEYWFATHVLPDSSDDIPDEIALIYLHRIADTLSPNADKLATAKFRLWGAAMLKKLR